MPAMMPGMPSVESLRGDENRVTIVLDLADPEGISPAFVFAIDCNNLGISTKEQIRERRRVVAASIAPWCNCSVAVSGFPASTLGFRAWGRRSRLAPSQAS